MTEDEKSLIVRLMFCTVFSMLFSLLMGDPYSATTAVTVNLFLYTDRGYCGSIRYGLRRVAVQVFQGTLVLLVIVPVKDRYQRSIGEVGGKTKSFLENPDFSTYMKWRRKIETQMELLREDSEKGLKKHRHTEGEMDLIWMCVKLLDSLATASRHYQAYVRSGEAEQPDGPRKMELQAAPLTAYCQLLFDFKEQLELKSTRY